MENELGNTKIFEHYLNLEQPTDKYICTYVWIDGFGKTTRCKSRTLKYNKNQKITLKDIPQWDCYGYITAQPNEIMSYQYLKPVALYRDPFLKKTNKLVMCQTYDQDKNPTILNNRDETYKLLEKYKSLEFKFGFEQEYVLIGKNKKPFKPQTGFPPELGPHYCGTGLCNAFGRAIPISHYKACLYAGISIFGINGEATPAQWEYQLGELDAVGISDQLWMSRYILERISEEFGVEVTFQPKPVPGNWCGSGGHCNFSTNETRGIDGLDKINQYIERLKIGHCDDIKNYDPTKGKENRERCTGIFFCPDMDTFTSGVEDKFASVRIPNMVKDSGRGYIEDRRPAANCDPYLVTVCIMKSINKNK